MNAFLNTEIRFVKGLGDVRAKLLNTELGIFTVYDLISYYPFRYVDRSQYHFIRDIQSDSQYYQIKGKITFMEELGYKANARLVASFFDGERSVELIWFKGVQWIKKNLKLNEEVVLFGKPTFFKGKINFAHPEIEDQQKKGVASLEAVYSVTENMRNRRMDSKAIRKVIESLLTNPQWAIPEIFNTEICSAFKLVDRSTAFRHIHKPANQQQLELAKYRLKFEELFFLQFPFIQQKMKRIEVREGLVFKSEMPLMQKFIENHLPFKLTNAQKRVIAEIKEDLCNGTQMNRLLQGDVGSGKTIVAFLSMLMAIDNGYQCALMAPTEILATQHYIGIGEWAKAIGIRVALLTGSTSQAERKELHRLLRLGEIHILIGTHALIEDEVRFSSIGLIVIDEQHRFGVAQRAKLQEKSGHPPHVLVMTATPIPRTLAMSVYGDLDYSVIDELPEGRKNIITAHRFGFARPKVWQFIKEQVELGRQAYVVYPLIEESESLHYKDLNNGYDELLKFFPRPKYQVDMLHGQMKADDKEATMQRFKRHESHILVSTTVIEVGIDVPNANIMVIESSEKFGLSQLHQLRGRVGRGAEQSYCILMSSKKLSENAETRLKAMVNTSSGFELSEIDMQLRGFGDIAGTRQSGLDQLKLASLGSDQHIAKNARVALIQLLKEDSELKNPKNAPLRLFIGSVSGFKEWSKIA